MSRASNEPTHGVSVFHMDFHKNVMIPKLTAQQTYYLRKIKLYAFGIHSAETNKGTTYAWSECTAEKNPETLVSCLDLHLRQTESNNRKWNIFWADNTRSQNKNHTVVFYFDYLVASGFRVRIDYKFLEAGHSFGAVDRDGGLAEGLFRNAEHLETPVDYAETINNSSLFPKLTWILPPQSAFKSYATWLRKTYRVRRKDIFNQAYRFSDTMYFNFGIGERVDPTDGIVKTFRHPNCVWLRKTLDDREQPIEVDFRRRTLERTRFREEDLSALSTVSIKPNEKTCQDLEKMLPYLRPAGKAYYNSILSSD